MNSVKEINIRVRPMDSEDNEKMILIIGMDRTKQNANDNQCKCIHIIETEKVVLEPTEIKIDSLWCIVNINISPSELIEDQKLMNEIAVSIAIKEDIVKVDKHTRVNML